MKTKLYVKDLQSNEILFNEMGQCLHDGKMTMFVMKNETFHSVWKILPKGILIENHQEADVILRLSESGSGTARIFSPYGELEARMTDVKIIRSENRVEVHYSIEEGETFGFQLCWQNSHDKNDACVA